MASQELELIAIDPSVDREDAKEGEDDEKKKDEKSANEKEERSLNKRKKEGKRSGKEGNLSDHVVFLSVASLIRREKKRSSSSSRNVGSESYRIVLNWEATY